MSTVQPSAPVRANSLPMFDNIKLNCFDSLSISPKHASPKSSRKTLRRHHSSGIIPQSKPLRPQTGRVRNVNSLPVEVSATLRRPAVKVSSMPNLDSHNNVQSAMAMQTDVQQQQQVTFGYNQFPQFSGSPAMLRSSSDMLNEFSQYNNEFSQEAMILSDDGMTTPGSMEESFLQSMDDQYNPMLDSYEYSDMSTGEFEIPGSSSISPVDFGTLNQFPQTEPGYSELFG